MCTVNTLNTDVAHEFAMTVPANGERTGDYVNYYKDNTA